MAQRPDSEDRSGTTAAGNYSLQAPPQGPCDGPGLRDAVRGGTAWLTIKAAQINALNVFPVPDGDTGTNMVLTMEAALKESDALPVHGAGEVAETLSRGALMGARGNSGVILSQIIRGLSRELDGWDAFDGTLLAEAFQAATQMAYRAVSKPVEGTILTVMRDCAEAATRAARRDPSLRYVLKEAVAAAWESVERTPNLLPILKDAGVVDAGGQGLAVLLEGMFLYFSGELQERIQDEEVLFPEEVTFVDVHGAEEFGYCTNFILQGDDLSVLEIREQISNLGGSVVVAGHERMVKVHVHTEYPGTILNYAVGLGSLHQIEITNMDEQRAELQPSRPAVPERPPLVERAAHPIMAIAVSPGKGLSDVLRSVGAAEIVAGGQTMNPSTEELLQAVDGLPCNQVIVLPNNSNVVMASRQAAALSGKDVRVVPTETVPQGIAALVAFNYEADLDTNAAAMEEAAASIQTAEVTWAVRDVVLNGIEVGEGQVIGLLNGVLEVAGEDEGEIIDTLVRRVRAEEMELITIYYGEDVSVDEAESLAERLGHEYPDQEIELISGGQPYYRYILSAE